MIDQEEINKDLLNSLDPSQQKEIIHTKQPDFKFEKGAEYVEQQVGKKLK